MQLQSESTNPIVQMQTMARASAMAFARADALVNALALEREVQAWAEAWAEAWTAWAGEGALPSARAWRVWAQAWAQVGAWDARAWALAQAARALALEWMEAQGEWMEAQRQAQWQTYSEVLADSGLMDIIYSIKPEYRHRLSCDLWRHSQHRWFIQIFVPITRLPEELLHHILLIIIDNDSHSPLVLMQVSKLWYTIVNGIWGSLNLGTTTPTVAVTKKLERNQRLLDVVIDTEFDHDDFAPSEDAYQAILAAIQAAPRWRSLVVETFPTQADLPEHLVNTGLQQCSDVVMSRLRTFEFKCPCETSSFLQHLLRTLGTAADGELTTVEINSASVITFLAPTYPSIFHSVKVLCLDIPRLPNPVDLLPHLHQLEAFTASHLSLPIYHDDVNLPFVHTLRHLTLRAVSIQWMSGRTFHALERCILLFPLHHHVLQTFSATLPNCNDLTFQGYPLDILNGVSAHDLTQLCVMCPCPKEPQGSRQLDRFSSHVLRENRLAPRVLHINIEATDQSWIKALAFMSNLEELVIGSAQPSSLGVDVMQSLILPVHASKLDSAATPMGPYIPLCPFLTRFGLRYSRWLRSSEHFDLILIPELASIIVSRKWSKFSLKSFRIWKGSDQEYPVELVDRSGNISITGFEGLIML